MISCRSSDKNASQTGLHMWLAHEVLSRIISSRMNDQETKAKRTSGGEEGERGTTVPERMVLWETRGKLIIRSYAFLMGSVVGIKRATRLSSIPQIADEIKEGPENSEGR